MNTVNNVLPFPVAKQPEEPKPQASEQVLIDVETMTLTELRKRYKYTAYSHQNMLKRRETEGAIIHPYLNNLKDFLLWLGANPRDVEDTHKYTLHRIDNFDKHYAPDKVKWSTKKEQNNNKKNVKHYYYDGNKFPQHKGESHSLTEWSEILNTSINTLRCRAKKSWTSNEIIEGRQKYKSGNYKDLSLWEYMLPNSNPKEVDVLYRKTRREKEEDPGKSGRSKNYKWAETPYEWLARVMLCSRGTVTNMLKNAVNPINGELDPRYQEWQEHYDRCTKITDKCRPHILQATTRITHIYPFKGYENWGYPDELWNVIMD